MGNKQDKDNIQKLVELFGALAETCGVFHSGLLKNGFSREEALVLTGEMLKIFIKIGM